MRTNQLSGVVMLGVFLPSLGFHLSPPLVNQKVVQSFKQGSPSYVHFDMTLFLDPQGTNDEVHEIGSPSTPSKSEVQRKGRLRQWAFGLAICTLITSLFHKGAIAPSHAAAASTASRTVTRNRAPVVRTSKRRNHKIAASKSSTRPTRFSTRRPAMITTRASKRAVVKTEPGAKAASKNGEVALIIGSAAGVLLGRTLIASKKIGTGTGISILGKNMIRSKKREEEQEVDEEEKKFDDLMGLSSPEFEENTDEKVSHLIRGQAWIEHTLEKVGYAIPKEEIDNVKVVDALQDAPVFSYHNDTMAASALTYTSASPALSSTALRSVDPFLSTSLYLSSLSSTMSTSFGVPPTYVVMNKKVKGGTTSFFGGSSSYLDSLSP